MFVDVYGILKRVIVILVRFRQSLAKEHRFLLL